MAKPVSAGEFLSIRGSFKDVVIPSWGGATIRIQVMSAKTAMTYWAKAKKKDADTQELLMWLFARVAIDSDGKPLIEDSADGLEQLRQLPIQGFLEVQKEIMSLNGFDKLEIGKDVEAKSVELLKSDGFSDVVPSTPEERKNA